MLLKQIILIILLSYTSLTWSKLDQSDQSDQSVETMLPSEVGRCEDNYRKIINSKMVHFEKKFNFALNPQILNSGKIQLFNEVFTVESVKNNSMLKKIKFPSFNPKNPVIVNRISFLMENKNNSFYELDTLVDPENIKKILHRTEVTSTEKWEEESEISLLKTVKVDLLFRKIKLPMTGKITVFEGYKNQWNGSILEPRIKNNYDMLEDLFYKKNPYNIDEMNSSVFSLSFPNKSFAKNSQVITFFAPVKIGGLEKTLVTTYQITVLNIESRILARFVKSFSNIIARNLNREIGKYVDASREIDNFEFE